MPKLKSVIAGLAVSTALTGALVAGGATAAVAMPTTAPVVANDDFGDDLGFNNGLGFGFFGHHHFGHRHKCGRHHGGGWGRRGKHKNICVVVRNFNFNDNKRRHHDRHHHRHHGNLIN
ncbi:hypothetical protein [Nonomuraea harbinensis]|uniref:DUF320 domain-containing protein n=1 Tax=Nonomuraea harbinensis TaxID=1286938 RepID=A0ABW1BXE7_9ACTN|nr:hypothetical protein [Nonomuraea harbinensis]